MFSSIWSKLKELLRKMIGVNTIQKTLHIEPIISSKMANAIELWSLMYEDNSPWLQEPTFADPVKVTSLGLPAFIASEKARMATIEMKSEITTPTESVTEANPNYVQPTIPSSEPSTESGTQSAYNITEERTAMLATASVRHALTAAGSGDDDSNGSAPADISLPTFQNEDFSGYTAEELAKEIQSQKESLRDMDLERRKLELEYAKQQKELAKSATICSTVKGTVEELQNMDDIDYSEPFAVINGGEGYYVQGTVTEDLLDTFVPGMEISCNSWVNDSSIFCTAVVTEVSEYPTTNTMGGSQNPNLSYYPFVAYITPDDGKGLTNGAYVDISLATQGDTDSLYISQMYVKKEDNRYFVYARNQQTGLLEKRYVTIGKSLYGSYYQIKSGLTNDDFIAVPFGKTVKEGVKTTSEYGDDSNGQIDSGMDPDMDASMYDNGMMYDASMADDGMMYDASMADDGMMYNASMADDGEVDQ